VKRLVTVELSEFAVRALEGEEGGAPEYVPARLSRGIRYYLGEAGTDRAEWRYPEFLRAKAPAKLVEVELRVDDELWGSLEDEAARQGITTQQMVEHAALVFASDINAGRVTQRILDRLDDE
jgi:hypothetical protein